VRYNLVGYRTGELPEGRHGGYADLMPRPPKKKGDGAAKAPRYPSRDRVKYTGIPREYWDLLDGMTGDGEEYEGRSVAFLAKIAVRAFLQSKGKLDGKGRPLPPAGG